MKIPKLVGNPIAWGTEAGQGARNGVTAKHTLHPANGSHKMAHMCAKVEYQYTDATGKTQFKTTPEHCGGSYRQTHQNTAGKQASSNAACAAAQQDVSLPPGATLVSTNCKTYESKR